MADDEDLALPSNGLATPPTSDGGIPATPRLYPPPRILISTGASKPAPPPPTQHQQQQRQQRWELRQQQWQEKQRALQRMSLDKQQSFRLHQDFQRRYQLQLQRPAPLDPLGPNHRPGSPRIPIPDPAAPRAHPLSSRNRTAARPATSPPAPASYLHGVEPPQPSTAELRPLSSQSEAARPTHHQIPRYQHPLANGVARQVDWLPPDLRGPQSHNPAQAAVVLAALIADARRYHQLHSIVMETSSYFNIRHTCAILSKLVHFQKSGSLSVRDVRLMATTLMPIVVDRIKSASVQFDGRSISTIVYSFGKLGVDDRDLVTHLTGVVEPWLETLTTQGLSIIMWGLCKADLTPETAWMDRYFACVLRSLPEFKPEELSTVMWSVSKLGYKATPSVMSDLLFHVQSSIHLYSTQSLSNVVYSLALSAHAPSTGWLEAMHAQVCKKANSFTPQGLTQVYWALAKLQLVPTADQLQPLIRHAGSHLETDYKAIDCSTLLYVFARFRTPPPPALLSRLMVHMPALMPEMEPCQLANSIWALGSLRLDFPHEAGAVWYEMFWSSSFRHLHLFGPTDLAQTLWGCARLRLLPPSRWTNAVKERVELQSSRFSPTEVTETVWALARLGCPVSTDLLNKLFASSENRLSSFKPKELSAIIWSLAHVNRVPETKWSEEFMKATFHKMSMFEPQQAWLMAPAAHRRPGWAGSHRPAAWALTYQPHVGIGSAMLPEDVLAVSYREYRRAWLGRGVQPPRSVGYMYCPGDERGNDYQNGPARHDFAWSVPIATQCLHAAGTAMAFKIRGEKRVAVCTIGDGGSSKGDFYGAINIAGAQNLPLVTVIVNNQWAISVPRKIQSGAPTLAQKGIAAGLFCIQVDGNDIIAVRKAMEDALERARSGNGGSVIEAVTYRLGDHTTADDARRYRGEQEVKDGWEREPMKRLRNWQRRVQQ
ncbi:MAG: hypothetical protein WDW36_006994 [Sanguina aurantia]